MKQSYSWEGRFLLALLWVVAGIHLQAQVVISEFMADNKSNLADNYGEYSDWIEVCNTSTTNINLLNWGLTDSATDTTPWLFPSTNLAAGGTLVVFASGRNIRVAGGVLHTDFKLAAAGEYLVLKRPDGTIATVFTPAYPAQIADVSYGYGRKAATTSLFNTNWQGRVKVPLDSTLGLDWTAQEFSDASWATATNAIGFESAGAATSVPADVLADAPLAYWRFTEQGTNSGALNLGSLGIAAKGAYTARATNSYVGLRPTNGFPGFEYTNRAAHFTNGSVVVSYQSALNPSSSFTVEAWAKPSGNSGVRTVLASQDRTQNSNNSRMGYVLYQSGTWEFDIGDYAGYVAKVTAGSPAAGKWTHVVGVYDSVSNSASLYLDGVLMGTVGPSRSYSPNTNAAVPFRIGAGTTSVYPFYGEIDEVAFFGRALTAAEIAQRFEYATAGGTNCFTGLIQTDLAASMLNTGSSAYLRLPFTLSATNGVSQLHLRLKYNDGFIAYLNGTEVAQDNAPSVPAWDSMALETRGVADSLELIDFDLSDHISLLRTGTNVLALHGLNVAATNSNFLLFSQLEVSSAGAWQTSAGYFFAPTPGTLNAEAIENPGPLVSEAAHYPTVPLATTGITVTGRVVQALAPVSSVTLNWRVMYEATNRTLAMHDDGAHGDGAAGDGVYGATIPSRTGGVANYAAGQMVRWYITATDTASRSSRLPVFSAGAATEEYFGTVIDPGFTGSALPVIYLYVSNYANGVGVDASSKVGGRASVYYDGEFYDNVFMKARGNSTMGYLKKSHTLEFNSAHQFRHPGPGGQRLSKSSFTADYPDPTYLRQRLTFWLCEQMGAPGPFYHPVRLQMNGEFYQLANHNDLHGEQLLERLGYDPNGALYNSAGTIEPSGSSTGGFDKKTRQWEGNNDYVAMANAIAASLSVGTRRTNIFDRLDLPEVINYMAAARFTHENDDVWANMSVYHDNDGDNLWRIIPFDMNLSWGAAYMDLFAFSGIQVTNDNLKSHPLYGSSQTIPDGMGDWNRLYDVIFSVPQTREMILRRLRTLLDTWVKPPGTAANRLPLEPMIRQWRDEIAAEAAVDRDAWGWPAFGGQCNFSPGITLSNGVEILINEFLAKRRQHFYGKHSVTNTALAIGMNKANNAGIPLAQPTNAVVSIFAWDYNPASGSQQDEYVCLTNANDYAVDMTGWRIKGGISHDFQPGTVIPAGMALYLSPNVVAFRARATAPHGGMGLFVQGSYSGQLSARGDSLSLENADGVVVASASYTGIPSLAQQYLRITEIMYNPAPAPAITDDEQKFEYIELKNISTNVTLNLSGVQFTKGITFGFSGSAVTSLAPGQRVLLVRNRAAFAARYGSGMLVAGEYSGALDNGGETLRLEDAVGEEVLEFAYDDGWYPITDGLGFSLVIVDDLASWDTWGDKASWRASRRLNGSPGTDDPAPPAFAPVLVNEALTHTDLPELDTIELFNPTATNVNLGGWFLTDDFFTPRKYRIPDSTTISAGSFLTFTTNQFGAGANGFALSEYGEAVYLFSGDAQTNLTGYYHGFDFGAAPNGVSFGRYVDSQGNDHYVLQATNTLGTTNGLPRVGPLVISEIMYHPPDLAGGVDDVLDEFIRLRNITATNVPLWCVFTNESGYNLAARTNTWRLRNAVDFNFPTNRSLAAGAQLLVVGFNPATNASQLAAFRLTYAVPANVAIYGPWSGKLDNSEDTLELKCPDKPDVTSTNITVPYVLVDKVTYHDTAPWPTSADGLGLSLQRRALAVFGNDPINWKAAFPGTNAVPDTDGDGMADWWETAHGLVVGINDAALDPDEDGMSNLQEYLAQTDPHDRTSVLRLAATPEDDRVVLSFEAQADLAYTVQFNDVLGSTHWQTWQQLSASPTNRTMLLTNVPPLSQHRFFRVVTPPMP